MNPGEMDPDATLSDGDSDLGAWFGDPRILTLRPAAGASDLALVVEEFRDGSRGRLWGGRPGVLGEPLPFPIGGLVAMATSDGEWVIDLDDGGGSEVGGLVAMAVDGSATVPLTPGREPYVVRGLVESEDGSAVMATIVDDDGYHVLRIPAAPWGPPEPVFRSGAEAWYGTPSADASLVSIDTTDHNPGIRRTAVTVVEVASGDTIAVLDDLPAGPVRAVRFSGVVGDPRLLVSTERTGFARPAVWNPRTGERVDYELPELEGEVLPLDWHAPSARILALHVDHGIHRLLEIDEHAGEARVVRADGSFAEPDVANVHRYQWASYFAPDGVIRILRSTWQVPIHVLEHDPAGDRPLIDPAPVPRGVALDSHLVTSADGTEVQLWLGLPPGREPIGTVLEIHGGPNLVRIDAYSPSAQAWIDSGFAYASLNYRGSVTFGRSFREGFWGVAGDREIEDVGAAVLWLRERGLADPASSFITGASYGGHMTLLSVGRLPEHFAGGLAHVAIADWIAAFGQMNPALRTAWHGFLGGRPEDLPELVAKYSAISYVDDVTASVWINQGALDTRTPVVGVQRYAELLAERGGDVVLEIFEGGHEPTGLDMMERDQRRMTELALRALAGRRWSEAGE